MLPNQDITFEFDGIRTLPVYSMIGKTKGAIPAFDRGKVESMNPKPQFAPSPYSCNEESLARASKDRGYAVSATNAWEEYANRLIHYLQFRDDSTKALTRALNNHNELLSLICDLRLGLDPTPLSRTFRSIMSFGFVQEEYRQDPNREEKYADYAARLDRVYKDLCDHRENAVNLIARMKRVMKAKRAKWSRLTPLVETGEEAPDAKDPYEAGRSTRGLSDIFFKVAVSFPGEKREYVSQVVDALRPALGKDTVFYDSDFQAQLARPNLDTLLQKIYRDQSGLIVVFLCADYAEKEWCGLEWRVVREIIKEKQDERVMFVRFDDAPVDGLLSIDGYIDGADFTPKQVADFILEREATMPCSE